MTNVEPVTIEYREQDEVLLTVARSEHVIIRGACERPGTHAVVPSPVRTRAVQSLGCPHGTETRPTVKAMVLHDRDANIWTMRSAGRVVAASPALLANACTSPLQRYPVTCSVSGLSGGSLSRIVTTQATHRGKQGTSGDGFPSSLGMLTRRGK